MVEISIGLGIILSLVLSEALGVTAGGIIVPGYIALFLHQPIQVVSTFAVAVIVLIIIKLLSRVMFLYGKRRIVLALIHALRARRGKRGFATACLGGGMATAIEIET